MRRVLVAERALDQPRQIAVGGPSAERPAQVDLALVEEAPSQVSVGGEAQPRAGVAERLAHRRDDADPPLVPDAVAPGGGVDLRHAGAAVVEAERLERELLL